jgi:hypothetical protein
MKNSQKSKYLKNEMKNNENSKKSILYTEKTPFSKDIDMMYQKLK